MMTITRWIRAVAMVGMVCGMAWLVAAPPLDASADRMTDGVVAAKQVCGLLGGGSDSKVTRDVGSGRVSTVATCKTAAGEYYCVIGNAGYEQCFAGPFPPIPAKARTANDAGPHVAPDEVIEASDAPDGRITVQVMVTTVPEEQVFACEALGGVGTTVSNGGTATVEVRCSGGVLDGTSCTVGHYDTYCTFSKVTTDPSLLNGVTPDTLADKLEDPAWDGQVVVYNQSGTSVDAAAAQVALCGLLGGSGGNDHDFETGVSTSFCHGGLLDGMYCTNFQDPDQALCVFEAVIPEGPSIQTGDAVPDIPVERQPSDEQTTVNPAPTTEPTVVPTDVSTAEPTVEPTVIPTDMPVEPTVAPTWSPPNNDNAAPPNNVVEPIVDPTPTPVVLL